MRREWLLPIAVGAIAGAMTFASAASLTVTSKDLTVLSVTATPPPTGDTTAPSLVSLEMFDDDANGKVDLVIATFDEPLAPYSASNTIWTLSNTPSGGTSFSVSVSGQTATLTLVEGSTANTAVGNFKVALAANANGIRDAGGNQSSFPATAPADKAAPVTTGLSSSNALSGSEGRPDQGDSVSISFSEDLDVQSVCATGWSAGTSQTLTGVNVTVRNQNEFGGSNDRLEMSKDCGGSLTLSLGHIDLGAANYVNATRTFTGSTMSWTPSTRLMVITLGASSNSGGNGTSNSHPQTFHQAATVADPAGNSHEPDPAPTFERTGTFF